LQIIIEKQKKKQKKKKKKKKKKTKKNIIYYSGIKLIYIVINKNLFVDILYCFFKRLKKKFIQ